MDVRELFLDSLGRTRPLLASDELADGWEHPSLLAELSVAGLAGHLVRAALSVERYLEAAEPTDPPIGPDDYYHVLGLPPDPDDDLNRGIRERGLEAAAGGPVALLELFDSSVATLDERFASETVDRRISVVAGLVLTLDGYLVTRLVELVVHADDLAQSIDVATPEFPPEAQEAVRACLIGVARLRHGDLGVLRALTRRERDAADALRVF